MRKSLLTLALLGALFVPASIPSNAAPLGITGAAPQGDMGTIAVVMRRAGIARGGAVGRRGVARRTTVVGPRGEVARRTTVVGRGGVARRTTVVRPGWRGAGTRWARPGRYWWRPGAAVAAGAAIGWVSAATAVAWAGAAPGPNMCWYYTDASHTQGFWDVCP